MAGPPGATDSPRGGGSHHAHPQNDRRLIFIQQIFDCGPTAIT